MAIFSLRWIQLLQSVASFYGHGSLTQHVSLNSFTSASTGVHFLSPLFDCGSQSETPLGFYLLSRPFWLSLRHTLEKEGSEFSWLVCFSFSKILLISLTVCAAYSEWRPVPARQRSRKVPRSTGSRTTRFESSASISATGPDCLRADSVIKAQIVNWRASAVWVSSVLVFGARFLAWFAQTERLGPGRWKRGNFCVVSS